jgi:acetate kinase
MQASINILTMNAGSSSIKTALYVVTAGSPALQQFELSIEAVGQSEAALWWRHGTQEQETLTVSASDMQQGQQILFDKLLELLGTTKLHAIGHRIVHGGRHFHDSILVNEGTMDELSEHISYDPDHLPASLDLLRKCQHVFEDCPLVACFDTGFFHDLPLKAQMLPLPRRYFAEGLRKYGFHGLSYRSIVKQLRALPNHERLQRVVIAHLGSGASLAAVRNGKPVDTTMSFTPVSGIPMSSRSGDLDPSVFQYLHEQHGMDIATFKKLIHEESGLLGVSDLSADMHMLLEHQSTNSQAAEAIELFCYQVQQKIGAFSAAMGGVDGLVFTGGIGQKSAIIRELICRDLAFLGIEIDTHMNNRGEQTISDPLAGVMVYVMPSDEAGIIVQDTYKVIKQ